MLLCTCMRKVLSEKLLFKKCVRMIMKDSELKIPPILYQWIGSLIGYIYISHIHGTEYEEYIVCYKMTMTDMVHVSLNRGPHCTCP